VQKVEGRWILTDEGRVEEARLRSRLWERSRRANKEIERIVRLQKEWDRTVGSRAVRQVDRALRSMPKIPTINIPNVDISPMPSVLENLNSIVETQGALPEIAASLPLQVDYQLRPFFETLRLVDSLGVGNPAISSTLEAVRESVQANQAAHMESISKAIASGLTSATLDALSNTLDLIHSKLGESVFASVQVRAVEDCLKRIPSSAIPPDVFKALTAQVDFASAAKVRRILEQADAVFLFDKDAAFMGAASDTLEDMASASLDDARSASLRQNWDELPEAVKLRFVVVATFIILYVALAAAQAQPDNSEYVKDLIHAIEGTAAVVAICKELELFNEE